jgi:hypothetical protein
LTARETIMKALFVDLGESFDDWDFSAGEALKAFMSQREYLEPEVRRAFWRLEGALETRTSSRPATSLLAPRLRPCPPLSEQPRLPSPSTRLVEWDANQLQGQFGLAQQDLPQ